MNINFSYLNNVNYSMNQRQDMLHALINKERLSQQNLMQVITDMDFGILKPV